MMQGNGWPGKRPRIRWTYTASADRGIASQTGSRTTTGKPCSSDLVG
jgi:hypothetical protein